MGGGRDLILEEGGLDILGIRLHSIRNAAVVFSIAGKVF